MKVTMEQITQTGVIVDKQAYVKRHHEKISHS